MELSEKENRLSSMKRLTDQTTCFFVKRFVRNWIQMEEGRNARLSIRMSTVWNVF